MLLENCVENPDVSASVRREPGCDLRATDFDWQGSYGFWQEQAVCGYQKGSGLRIVEPELPAGTQPSWDMLKLAISPSEYAEYTFYSAKEGSSVTLEFVENSSGMVEVFQDGDSLGTIHQTGTLPLKPAPQTVIRVQGRTGEAILVKLKYR